MAQSRKWTSLAIAAMVFLLGAGAARAAQTPGSWSGTVASVKGDDVALVGVRAHFRLAGSVTEMASGRSIAPQTLAPGTSVTLRVGGRESDGRFRADRIVVGAKSPLSVTGAIGRIADDRRHIEVQGVEIELDRNTGFSGRGSSGSLRSARDLRPGAVVSASLVPTKAGTLRAAEIRAALGTAESGEDQELKGTVMDITDTAWTIDTKIFVITDQTVFEGEPGLGDMVEVKFHDDGTGVLVADRIEKEDEAPGTEVEFMGIVDAIGDTSWTISGQVVGVDPSTQIIGNPQVGDSVEVEAHRAPDGTLTAEKIQREDAAEQEVEFTGDVETISDSSWTISGQTVLVDASTRIDGSPAVGDTVEVKAMKASDGTLTATRIKKEDSANGGQGSDDGDTHDAGDDNGGQGNDDGDNHDAGDDGSSGNDDGGNHHGNGNDDTGSDD